MPRMIITICLAITVTILLLGFMAGLIKFDSPIQNSIGYLSLSEPSKEEFVGLKGNTFSQKPECSTKLIREAQQEVKKYQSCKHSQDCEHIKYGFLPMLATNKEYHYHVKVVVEKLKKSCGPRDSHDTFYSDFGIEISCNSQNNQCQVKEVTSDIMYNRLREETRNALFSD